MHVMASVWCCYRTTNLSYDVRDLGIDFQSLVLQFCVRHIRVGDASYMASVWNVGLSLVLASGALAAPLL